MEGKPSAGVDTLLQRLGAAVRIGDVKRVTEQIKCDLESLSTNGAIRLPSRFRECCGEGYARRLLHRDPELGYTVVVMTWGPGQGTELHDHAGMWCVECVLDGRLEVTQYAVVEQNDELYRFEKREQVQAGIGEAGCLIPPYEYHVLSNALKDQPTITLHVYGGEMDRCNLYRPQPSGWWRRVHRDLGYVN